MRSILYSDDAGCISKTWSHNTGKWGNSGIINPLLDGLTYNLCIHLSCIFTRPCGAGGKIRQSAKYKHVLYVKPPNKMYLHLG